MNPGKAPVIFVVPPGHFHKSIRSCLICRPAAVALYGKRWRVKRPEESYQHTLELQREGARRRAALVPRICKVPGCGNIREKGHQFCAECVKDALRFKETRYVASHREEINERRRRAAAARGGWRTESEKAERRASEKKKRSKAAARRARLKNTAKPTVVVEEQVKIDVTN